MQIHNTCMTVMELKLNFLTIKIMFELKYSTVVLYLFKDLVWSLFTYMQYNCLCVAYSLIQSILYTLFCLITLSIYFHIFQCTEDCEVTSYKELWTLFRKLSAMYGYSECQLWLVCNPGRVCFSGHHITKKNFLIIKTS